MDPSNSENEKKIQENNVLKDSENDKENNIEKYDENNLIFFKKESKEFHFGNKSRKESILFILKSSWKSFVNSFVLSYAIRTGISVLLRIIQLIRKKQLAKLFSFHHLFSEKNLIVRVDAIRLGLSVGGFVGIYKLLNGFLKLFGPIQLNFYNSFISGFIAGFSLLFQEKKNRRTPALYLLARFVQCIYNSFKRRGWWHFWGSHWSHGDTLLFLITSAQVMYGYIMRPETLPDSYYKFIVRTGPIDERVLQAVRACNRKIPVDVKSVIEYCKENNKNVQITEFPDIIPCEIIHPHTSTCLKANILAFISTCKKILPVYASITFVPLILLKFMKLIKRPIPFFYQAILGTIRSTIFLASFVTIYESVICIHRKLVTKDYKFIYFFAGLISSLSILIEKKSRRSELALYTLPRALDSFYMVLCDHKWMASFPYGEILLFCLSMGGLMHFWTHESEAMSPFINYILTYLFRKHYVL